MGSVKYPDESSQPVAPNSRTGLLDTTTRTDVDLVEAAQRGDTHRYSVSRGIPRLRRAVCNWYRDQYEVALDPETQAIVTIGSKEGLAHLALACMGPGDSVLVPNPAYPIHPYGFIIAGAEKLKTEMIDKFQQKHGVRPCEGYGATECAPLIALNVPDVTIAGQTQIGTKDGTVGHTIPGLVAGTRR